MKAFLFSALIISLVVSSCHRKSAPSSGKTSNSTTGNSTTTNSNTTGTTETKKVTSSYGKALVVVDGKGSLVSDKETLLANGAKSGFPSTSARAFTPQERANLLARFKTVPPRVMHVPDNLSKKNCTGTILCTAR